MSQHLEYSDQQLDLFKSLFRGRVDVFAIFWQKKKRSGYMPAYHYDPYMYRLHRMKGGSFKDYKDKTYLPLTNHEVLKHLRGEQHIGVYPLLLNNTSWFIAADFDKSNWKDESIMFMETCDKYGLPSYLEKSKSGNGGHVWLFYNRAFPAIESRRIFIWLLEQAGIISKYDINSSFDRLFPNQDFLSGKRLGNLIALPLNGEHLEKGNNCFVDRQLNSYQDQWSFLSSIERVDFSLLKQIQQTLNKGKSHHLMLDSKSDKMRIVLAQSVCISKAEISSLLRDFLKKKLNIANSEYFIKKNTGSSTWDTKRYFQCIEESGKQIFIPRGYIGKVLRFCKSQKIEYDFIDNRCKHSNIDYSIKLELQKHQKVALDVTNKKEFGVISAPPGSGKTVIGLKIISKKKQPALIIVHRKHLLDQWLERIQTFLEIPKKEIGKIGQGRAKIGKKVTVAMIQSLGKQLAKNEIDNLQNLFGLIIIDECHHVPAKSYREVISKFNPYYQYGLTATPFRKGSIGKLIFIYLGDLIVDIKPTEIEHYKRTRLVVRNTSFNIPFNHKTDSFETLSKVLIHDSERNKRIVSDITKELNKGRRAIIITERKDHIITLYQFLKQHFEIITLSGESTGQEKQDKWKLLNEGRYQALITTGQYFGEGSDLNNASCLFLVYPFAFKGKLIQYIGRVQRSELTPIIYDYRDIRVEYLNKLFLKRNVHYRNLDREATLFDDINDREESRHNYSSFSKEIKVAIQELEFLHGAASFKYFVPDLKKELEFEIENESFLPEFKVLREYFAKILQSKYIKIKIVVEYNKGGEIIAQLATSTNLSKINKEIIETIKFKFVEKDLLNNQSHDASAKKILDLRELQKNHPSTSLYKSEMELLNSLLDKNYLHNQHLKYLVMRHVHSLSKLRFILSPFSFLFLLEGESQHHIILETLDTREATYMWHLENNANNLSQCLDTINEDLNWIRNKGRRSFLKDRTNENFSKIQHDYSDNRSGFIRWKNLLEERLF